MPNITSCEVKLILEFVHFFQYDSKVFPNYEREQTTKILLTFIRSLKLSSAWLYMSSYGSEESVNSEYKEQELSKVFIAFWNNCRALNASTCGVNRLNDCCAMSKMLKVSWIPLLPYWCTIIGYDWWGNNFPCYKLLKTKKYSLHITQSCAVN